MGWRYDSSSEESSGSSDEELTAKQLDYLEFGEDFVKLAGLEKWLQEWDGDFTFSSDCPWSAFWWGSPSSIINIHHHVLLLSLGSGIETPLMALQMLFRAGGQEHSIKYMPDP